MPQDFATALVAKLKPGVEFMLQTEYPAQGSTVKETTGASD
jgi:hypothetical protein